MRKIVLCGRGGCCPEVSILNDDVIIEDDYGNTARMTVEQFDILVEKRNNGEI